MRLRPSCALFAAWFAASAMLAGQAPLRRDAEQLKLKIASINQRGVAPPARRVTTPVTEQEVNAYLVYEASDLVPAGIVDPRVTMLGAERVAAQAIVDLDEVRAQRNPSGLLDPLRYLRGRLLVKATGTIQAKDGVARLDLESADIAGVPIPKILLQQIVTHYSKSPARPSGISLDDPLTLPSGIREIQVERGQALIVQ